MGVKLIQAPNDRGALGTLLALLIGSFAVGLIRAWQLLGATHQGCTTPFIKRLRRPAAPTDAAPAAGGAVEAGGVAATARASTDGG